MHACGGMVPGAAVAAGGCGAIMTAVHAGDEVHFKVKPTTKFEKIFNAWKTRKAVQTGVRFVVDGVQLHEHRTPGKRMEAGSYVNRHRSYQSITRFLPSGLLCLPVQVFLDLSRSSFCSGREHGGWGRHRRHG
jgi:Ubiquitin-2 like Rad60 SUMO-like